MATLPQLLSVCNKPQSELCSARDGLASVWFRIKGRPSNGIFGFGRTRNGTRAKKKKEGGGGGEGRKKRFVPFFPAPPSSFTLAIFDLLLAVCSENARKRLLRRLGMVENCTEYSRGTPIIRHPHIFAVVFARHW